jgi:hypothetical protein
MAEHRQGKIPGSSTRALCQACQQGHLVAKEEDLAKGSLTCRKILRHGADGFTSPPKEGVLRIFTAFKNPSTRPGLIPRTLGPVASTITTRPPRTTWTALLSLTLFGTYTETTRMWAWTAIELSVLET